MKRLLASLSFILLFVYTLPDRAHAQFGEDWAASGCLQDGVATLSCVPIVFKNIITSALFLAGTLALLFLMYSGYKYVTSGGDPKKAESARKTITYALLGLFLILFSFLIVEFIGFVTGVSCINQFGFTNCE